jgi:tetratricopeptide (TPR) repeat protein
VLALEGEVATAIVEAIGVEIHPDERRRLVRATAVRSDAYESYLKGRFYWSARGKGNAVTAASYFQRAVEQDPTFAAGYSGLSDSYRLLETAQDLAPRECMPKAAVAARKALALDDTLAEAHVSLATVLFRYGWDWAGAEREYRRALELDPNSAEGHRAYAVFLLTMRRAEEAVTQAERARELSPLSVVIAVEAAYAKARTGRFAAAAEDLARAREIDPGSPRIDLTQAIVHLQQGKLEEAVAVFDARRAARKNGAGAPGPWSGYAYGIAGRTADAQAVLASLTERSAHAYISPQSLAVVELGLGHREEALTLLEKAADERAIEVLGFSGPLFDILHDEPRYRALAERIGLADAYW